MFQDELVDIVDEQGNFVEVIAKKVAHEKGLLHKTTIGVVINSKGEYLMVKPVSGRQDAGQYVFPVGGHVTSGEEDIEAIKREAEEEIGLKGEYKIEYVGRQIFNRFVIGRQENHVFIIYKIFTDMEPVLGDEDDSFKYFTEEELKNGLKTTPKLFGEVVHFQVKDFFPNLLS